MCNCRNCGRELNPYLIPKPEYCKECKTKIMTNRDWGARFKV